MICVAPQPEPGDFDALVRQPGQKWLEKNPAAKASDYPDYWRHCKKQLFDAFGQVCSYCCWRRSFREFQVDHFLPKSKHRDLAYEWSNYRLALGSFNNLKLSKEGLLDPFEVPQDGFRLDVASGALHVNGAAFPDKEMLGRAEKTCSLLNEFGVAEYHLELIQTAAEEGQGAASFLRRQAPFVYRELVREGYLKVEA